MPRYKLTIEYDGHGFVGWQRQENGPSIQGELEVAFQAFTGQAVDVYGAGRTDAGVHAWGQVAHVDLDREWPVRTVRDAVNAHLGDHAIQVLQAERVDDDFHARFSARLRRYRYYILNRRARPALWRGKVWHIKTPLDVAAMDAAARCLIGRHDFTTFRAAQCQAQSPIKSIDTCSVKKTSYIQFGIEVNVSARSFLHNQVRSIVGSLKMVGDGHWSHNDFIEALQAKDRRRCGPVAPACGLYLASVDYSENGNTDL